MTGPRDMGSSAAASQAAPPFRMSSRASGCRDLLTGRNGGVPDFCSVRVLWVPCRVCHTAFVLFVYNIMSSFNSVFPKAGQNKINSGIKRKRI